MAISLQADSTLPQGYILVDGQRVASVSTTGGLSATNIETAGRILATSTNTLGSFSIAAGAGPRVVGGNSATVDIHGTTGTRIAATRWTNDQFGPIVNFLKSRGPIVGTRSILLSTDWTGEFNFYGDDGTNDLISARILAGADGIPISGSVPGKLIFYTTLSGDSTASERMRITNTGNIGINTGSSNIDTKLQVVGDSDGANVISATNPATTGSSSSITLRPGDAARTVDSGVSETGNVFRWGGTATNSHILQFRRTSNVIIAQMDTSGVLVSNLAGSGNRAVFSNPSGYLTNSSSDNRLKENVISVTSALDKVTNLNSVYYNWKDKEKFGTETSIGLIAQDVKDVVPELVYQNNDGMYGVHYDQVGPLLINAVKELKQQLDLALQRISELESN